MFDGLGGMALLKCPWEGFLKDVEMCRFWRFWKFIMCLGSFYS